MTPQQCMRNMTSTEFVEMVHVLRRKWAPRETVPVAPERKPVAAMSLKEQQQYWLRAVGMADKAKEL